MKFIEYIKSYRFKWAHIEGWFWIFAIIALALTNPDSSEHYSLCLFHNLGFNFCPGCGIGHSIALFFRLRFIESFQAHPLGIIAIFFLLRRSYQIFFKSNIHLNTNCYEQSFDTPTRN